MPARRITPHLGWRQLRQRAREPGAHLFGRRGGSVLADAQGMNLFSHAEPAMKGLMTEAYASCDGCGCIGMRENQNTKKWSGGSWNVATVGVNECRRQDE